MKPLFKDRCCGCGKQYHYQTGTCRVFGTGNWCSKKCENEKSNSIYFTCYHQVNKGKATK